MRSHLSNATYGVLDYAAYPMAMLLAAPTLLHHLGISQYGVWVVCTAAVSTGGIIASGFGDANIQHIATQRSRNDKQSLIRAVRSMVGINLLLGLVIATVSFLLVPVVASHVVSSAGQLFIACVWSLRLASLLMLVRALESVCVSTQRAFERYGDAIRVSVLVRIVTVAIAALISQFGYGVTSIMLFTFVLMTIGTVVQLWQVKRLVEAPSLVPMFDREAFRVLFAFGIFTWLQAISGVIFSQADRLILGVSLGATVVAAYALCVQLAQPIYGIAASGLHFLFPYLAGRNATAEPGDLRRPILIAVGVNVLFVAVASIAVVLVGRPLMQAWVGEEIARSSSAVLVPIVVSFALLGLNVTAYYALLALGRVRIVTSLNLIGGAVMLLLTALMLPTMSVRGVALARLAYGLITLGMYYPLLRAVFFVVDLRSSAPGSNPVCEEV